MSTDNSFTGILDNIKKDQDKLKSDMSTIALNLMQLANEVARFIELHNGGRIESSRVILIEKYNQLTQEQKNRFIETYGCKPEGIPEDEIELTIIQLNLI